jgi:hypothetical protein
MPVHDRVGNRELRLPPLVDHAPARFLSPTDQECRDGQRERTGGRQAADPGRARAEDAVA